MTLNSKNFVTIIFSKDRPLQLDLTLKTNEIYCKEKNIRNQIVLYKTSNQRFENAYQSLAREYPDTKFVKEINFKQELLSFLDKKEYVLFVVDDCVFTREYSLQTIHDFLSICGGVLGFSLRLGENTTHCYPLWINNSMPQMQTMGKNIYAFNWKEAGAGDFSYPLEVSSSIYRVETVYTLLKESSYYTPNSLEWVMSISVKLFNSMPFMLCYETSPAFCNPINKIQTENNNRVGINPAYTIENFLTLYENGYRIDHSLFKDFVSNGAHQEVDIDFIKVKNGNNR